MHTPHSAVCPLLLVILCLSGCGDAVVTDEVCPTRPISQSVSHLFYWGEDDAMNWAANTGRRAGSGSLLQWVTNDRLVMVTAVVQHGDTVRAIAMIELDDGEFKSVTIHPFEPVIWDLRVDRDSGAIFLLYFSGSAADPSLGRVTLGPGSAAVDSVLLDESWKPWGVAPHPADDTIIVCATKPGETEDGFYRLSGSGEPVRVQDCALTLTGARAMEVGSDSLLYYPIHFVGNARSLLVRWDMRDPGSFPLVIHDGPGVIDRLAVDPSDTARLLIHRRFFAPAGNTIREEAFDLMETHGLVTVRLDVRTSTNLCRVVRNGFAAWRGDGAAIVFPGWSSIDGEETPSSLWVKWF